MHYRGKGFRLSAFLLLILTIYISGCSKAVSVEEKELAPDFTLSSVDGTNISLSDFQGQKPVLAVFWATWCPFCVQEIPVLNRMADEYGDKVEVLGIDIKENTEKVADFLQGRGIKYKVLLDSTGEVAEKYGVLGIPLNVLIDKDGSILYKGHSIEECEEIITKFQ